MKVANTAPNNDSHGQHQSHPENARYLADRLNVAIEQPSSQKTYSDGQNLAFGIAQRRNQVPGIVSEAYRAGSRSQWCRQHDLPKIKKAHEAAERAWSVGLLQVIIRTAVAGHRSAQFRPDQAVAGGDDGSQYPSEQGLRPLHGGQNQRDGEKRPNTHH